MHIPGQFPGMAGKIIDAEFEVISVPAPVQHEPLLPRGWWWRLGLLLGLAYGGALLRLNGHAWPFG